MRIFTTYIYAYIEYVKDDSDISSIWAIDSNT